MISLNRNQTYLLKHLVFFKLLLLQTLNLTLLIENVIWRLKKKLRKTGVNDVKLTLSLNVII